MKKATLFLDRSLERVPFENRTLSTKRAIDLYNSFVLFYSSDPVGGFYNNSLWKYLNFVVAPGWVSSESVPPGALVHRIEAVISIENCQVLLEVCFFGKSKKLPFRKFRISIALESGNIIGAGNYSEGSPLCCR